MEALVDQAFFFFVCENINAFFLIKITGILHQKWQLNMYPTLNIFFIHSQNKKKATPYFRQGALDKLPNFNIPFYFGREDVNTCSYTGNILPSAMKDVFEIKRVFIDNLGLDVPEVVALMGAHSLGTMVGLGSGFQGQWKQRIDTFTTQYYTNLLNYDWIPKYNNFGNNGVTLQWQHFFFSIF